LDYRNSEVNVRIGILTKLFCLRCGMIAQMRLLLSMKRIS